MTIAGTWEFDQSSVGSPPFIATLGTDGTISVEGFPKFFGLWNELASPLGSTFSLAISYFSDAAPIPAYSLTLYWGVASASDLKGTLFGGQLEGPQVRGPFSAKRLK